MDKTKPLLSIGLIFKNEIRCLERCLSSFNNLKKAIPCEIIAADTGSDDGSHEVAERYADILIDFPWINDFAAARNAVMDRASGTWFLTIDADEWLDKDISGLVHFLKNPMVWKRSVSCSVTIRNYTRYDLTGGYNDFVAVRLLRMSTGYRYMGAIHERWHGDLGSIMQLSVIFHHDGYVGFGGPDGAAKRERNMTLLREEYEKNPDDLLRCLQCIESSQGEETEMYLQKAMEGVRAKRLHWEHVGPAVFRYATLLGQSTGNPEWKDWAAEGAELFPNSFFIRIDIANYLFQVAAAEKRYEDVIRYGEQYLTALTEYRGAHAVAIDLSYSSLYQISESVELTTKAKLAGAYFEMGNFRKAKNLLSDMNFAEMELGDVLQCVATMMNVHSKGKEDLRLALSSLWSQIDRREDAQACREAVIHAVFPLFSTQKRKENPQIDYRTACEMFAILEGKCVLGDAAALMAESKPKRLNGILARYENLTDLPASALLYALTQGAALPLKDKPMNMEEMDAFAARLMEEPEDFLQMACVVEPGEDRQSLCWAKTAVVAGVKICDWSDSEVAVKLARTFAEVERRFLPLCYAQDALSEENCFLLPPMHRFGWYCSRAYQALDNNDRTQCVRLLRLGLETCPEMSKMVEFLLGNIPELQFKPDPRKELEGIADRVRQILALYDPNDPAVEAIKQSEVYQKVAYLIEGMEVPVAGGMLQ